jgi:hypothetical protein
MVLATSRAARTGAATAAVLAFSGCMLSKQDNCANVGCTDEFRTIVVHVTDAADKPVTGLQPTWTLDGHTVTIDQEGASFDPGGYAVITDAELHLIGDTAEVTFAVSSAQGSASATFEISTEPCHCHVSEVSGPTTLVLH